jgi:demethylmenaquinone methyltransferase/2-methoxy-6-polyprenyl-1,4-benzoquinol methylase
VYLAYFRWVLPRIGRVVSKHTSAYGYLPDSVHAFPDPAQVVRQIGIHGFGSVRHLPLTFGVTGLYAAERLQP